MRVVIALGGNALQSPHDARDDAHAHVRSAVRGIVAVAADHDVVLTHGNGPQVGLLAAQPAAVASLPHTLDALGAQTDGLLGYLLQLELLNQLPDTPVATLLTLVEVDRDDDAFTHPSKPIGLVLDDDARERALALGWQLVEAAGGWRRVVASPTPTRLVSAAPLRTLVDTGTVVVCGGGGGIPVIRTAGGLVGVDAVVDKDATTVLVADAVRADLVVFATDVDAVYDGWGTPRPARLRHETVASLQARSFAAGSMQPKVNAACDYVARTGRHAVIGSLAAIPELVAGSAGTVVSPSCSQALPEGKGAQP